MSYHTTHIRFTGREPTPEELARLGRALKSVDSDAPPLSADGMLEKSWRNPALDLGDLLALLERAGFPCEGYQFRERPDWPSRPDPLPWQRSGPASVRAWLLREWDDALKPYDPSAPDVVINAPQQPPQADPEREKLAVRLRLAVERAEKAEAEIARIEGNARTFLDGLPNPPGDVPDPVYALGVLSEGLAAENRRLSRVRDAVAYHHAQKADDRCVYDDDVLYRAAGLPPCDRRVGDKFAMIANCVRFVRNRCEGGGPWKSYAELEAQNARYRAALESIACYEEGPVVTGSFDEPGAAGTAREALEGTP